MNKYVLLDFCETVVDFQTFDAFIEYILQKKRPWLYKICNCKFLLFILNKMTAFLTRLGFEFYFRKHLLVACTIGMKKDDLKLYGKRFYEEIIRNHYIYDTIQLIRRFQQEKLEIIVISGGSRFYIDCFADSYEIHHVLSAEIFTVHDISMGILKRECLGTEKLIMLDEYMKEHTLSGEFEYAVTDSKSDMPILRKAKKAIVISHKKHKNWVDENMEEIIWE